MLLWTPKAWTQCAAGLWLQQHFKAEYHGSTAEGLQHPHEMEILH